MSFEPANSPPDVNVLSQRAHLYLTVPFFVQPCSTTPASPQRGHSVGTLLSDSSTLLQISWTLASRLRGSILFSFSDDVTATTANRRASPVINN